MQFLEYQLQLKQKKWPWFGGIGMDEAVTTDAWTVDEAAAFAIQPAKALALAAAAAGGKG